ncbi:MAG: PAS domain-containing protein [Alphaproteobacteria bacterium]|nr:PAS domain-containing protein [Alphaproteobacteria bacterium]
MEPKALTAQPGAFPIVGLGASAGGLEAFEAFFRHVPAESGMAFVLVQHLDPSHASILTEILQRTTAMPVVEVTDQMVVEPNRVYVIPPNREMALFHGTLLLRLPEQVRGQRMPIDAFLRSLAEDQGEKAIGILLSGTGTDGTLGLRALLGNGGISLVQEPSTAQYDGMPQSAIHAGFATHVLPPERMSEVLLASRQHRVKGGAAPPALATVGSMNQIMMTLRSVTGHDFSGYKKSTIGRRIERRMAQHNIEDAEVYARFLKNQPAEAHALFRELLINVTSFFRDPEAFETLKNEVLPQILADKPDGYILRVWVAGCATGEEAYSIAMVLREVMEEARHPFSVQLYSTDLDDDAIATARAGLYPPNITQDVTPERLRRFFAKEDAGYRVKKDIREMVVFAIQNVIKDPPFTKMDLVSCRNLMIYLEADLQKRLIPAFHYALKPGGVLLLSPSESIGGHTDLFSPLSRKWKFYRATPTTASVRTAMAGSLSWATDPAASPQADVMIKAKDVNIAELTRRALVQSFAPASVVTDLRGDILYVHGDTGKYLRPPPGLATLNVVDMAHEGLQMELRAALNLAVRQRAPTLGRDVLFSVADEPQRVSLGVRPLADLEPGQEILLVSFQDLPVQSPQKSRRRKSATSAEPSRVEELERDLAYTRENLQATIEEQQSSNEELKSTNEELQSTNEELQSTNEELETSKEELQSVNEELVTVNAELQAKIEELAGMQNDMKNLLDNINIGTIFLDDRFKIRRFTREAAKVYRVVATDIGRPLSDIKSDLDGDDLLARAQTVIETLIPHEQEVRTIAGEWYLTRIQPYRTLDNVIDGVVMTFAGISDRKAAETSERQGFDIAEAIIDAIGKPMLVLDEGLAVVSASCSFYQEFRLVPAETRGRPIYALGNRQWDIPALRTLLETILPQEQSFDGLEVEHVFAGLGHRKMRLSGRRIFCKSSGRPLILLTVEDIAET